MNLYEAVSIRHSVRKYRMEAIEDTIIQGIFSLLEKMESLFPKVKTEISITENLSQKAKLKGLVNVTAPYYLSIYSEKKEKSDMNAGYIMQQLSLYLTTQGIGSCFMGMAKKKDRKMEEAGLEFVITMAFGYPKTAFLQSPKGTKRLSLEALCVYKEQPKKHVKELLEAARLAPSSLNSQPWCFAVYENRFHIFSKKPVVGHNALNKFNEFNFGIMLANCMLAAEELWIDVDLIKLDNITHKTLPNNQYVISLLIKA